MLNSKKLLRYCTTKDYFIKQMDVETAFLNGPVKSKVYVKQSKGYEKKKSSLQARETVVRASRKSTHVV